MPGLMPITGSVAIRPTGARRGPWPVDRIRATDHKSSMIHSFLRVDTEAILGRKAVPQFK